MPNDIPRHLYVPFVAVFLLLLTSCSDMPLRDHLIPTPTRDPEVLRRSIESAETHLIFIGLRTGDWHAALLLGQPMWINIEADGMLRSAEFASLSLDAEDFQQIESLADVNLLIRDLGDEIEAKYGKEKRAEFEHSRLTQAAEKLLADGPEAVDAASLPAIAGWASSFLLSAVQNAEKRDIPAPLNEDGRQLAIEIVKKGVQPDHAEKVAAWEKAVRFAAMDKPTPVPTPTVSDQAGTDIAQPLPPGNPLRGELLSKEIGCAACHVDTPIGPPWRPSDMTLQERFEEHWQRAEYAGSATSIEEYVIESILQPHIFEVDYPPQLMPNSFGHLLSRQDLADIVAFLMQIE